jgi:hypothetical protein
MKTVLVLFLFFIFVNLSASQDRSLAGFENIRWGESQDIAKVKMLKIDGIRLHSIFGKSLRFENGIYLNEKVLSWNLYFGKTGFERIIIEFVNDEDQDIKFNKILKILRNKYGEPKGGLNNNSKKSFWNFKNRDTIGMELSDGGNSLQKGKTLKLYFFHILN